MNRITCKSSFFILSVGKQKISTLTRGWNLPLDLLGSSSEQSCFAGWWLLAQVLPFPCKMEQKNTHPFPQRKGMALINFREALQGQRYIIANSSTY